MNIIGHSSPCLGLRIASLGGVTAAVVVFLFLLVVEQCNAYFDSILSIDTYTFDEVVFGESFAAERLDICGGASNASSSTRTSSTTAGQQFFGVREPTATLVKFDRKYGFGDPMKHWRVFAEAIGKLSIQPESSAFYFFPPKPKKVKKLKDISTDSSFSSENIKKSATNEAAASFLPADKALEVGVSLEPNPSYADELLIAEVNCNHEPWQQERDQDTFNMDLAEQYGVEFPADDYYAFQARPKLFVKLPSCCRSGTTAPVDSSPKMARIIDFNVNRDPAAAPDRMLSTSNLLRFSLQNVPSLILKLNSHHSSTGLLDLSRVAFEFCSLDPNPFLTENFLHSLAVELETPSAATSGAEGGEEVEGECMAKKATIHEKARAAILDHVSNLIKKTKRSANRLASEQKVMGEYYIYLMTTFLDDLRRKLEKGAPDDEVDASTPYQRATRSPYDEILQKEVGGGLTGQQLLRRLQQSCDRSAAAGELIGRVDGLNNSLSLYTVYALLTQLQLYYGQCRQALTWEAIRLYRRYYPLGVDRFIRVVGKGELQIEEGWEKGYVVKSKSLREELEWKLDVVSYFKFVPPRFKVEWGNMTSQMVNGLQIVKTLLCVPELAGD
jgi:hypothetical protein